MRQVFVRGVLPGIITENTGPRGWVGNLGLSGDLAGLTGIETTGPGADWFAVRYDAAHALAVVQPAMLADYEMFRLLGILPELVFSLRFVFADGEEVVGGTVYEVAVANLDDTPPTALGFQLGGSVAAGAMGAVIGVLRVTDIETTAPFSYRLDPDDDWMFVVEGNTLRLRDGISLGLDDIGTRLLRLEVVAGLQSAAFTLPITVTAPDDQQLVLPLLERGENRGGFRWAEDGAVELDAALAELAGLEGYGNGLWQVFLRSGVEVWLADPPALRLRDGSIGFTAGLALHLGGATGPAALTRFGGGDGADLLDASALPAAPWVVAFEGRAGDDTLLGAGGFAVVASYGGSPGAILVDLAAGVAQDGWGGTDSLRGIRRVAATSVQDDSVHGSAGDELFEAGADGNKRFEGRGGTDAYRTTASAPISIDLGGIRDPGGGWLGSAVKLGGTDVLLGITIAVGGGGADSLHGSPDRNLLAGEAGNDTLDGGGGTDVALYDASPWGGAVPGQGVVVNLATGVALDPWGGTDTLRDIYAAWGTPHADRLIGVAAAIHSELRGLAGNDTLVAPQADSNVLADYSGDPAAVTVNLKAGLATDGWGDIDSLIAIQAARGSPFADRLTGGDRHDALFGEAGDDTLDGGGGIDWLYGGPGNDTYIVNLQTDLVFENPAAGIDTVISTAGFYLYANLENLTLAAGAGNIFGVGTALDNLLTGNQGNNLMNGQAGQDTLLGGDGHDLLYGGPGADWLEGGPGNDYLAAGTEDDTLLGGPGGDQLWGEAGNDSLVGGPDFVFDMLVGGLGNDWLDGASGFGDYDYLYGNAGDDTFLVDTPADLVFEQPNEGDDTVYANISGAGYYLYGNIEVLILLGKTPFGVGNALDNVLKGNDQPNWLLGGTGNDTLNGKGGRDVLFGQSGLDTFVIEAGTGADIIGDFVVGVDQLQLLGYGLADRAAALALGIQVGTDTALRLPGGDMVVLQGVTLHQLASATILLH